jgi:hypothetical protein
MPMSLLETSIYVHPQFPVEFVIRLDDKPIRVSIEWSAIEWLMGPVQPDADQVRDFLHHHRREIAFAIRAQLAAHGTPLTGQLTVSVEDLRLAGALWQRLGASRPRHGTSLMPGEEFDDAERQAGDLPDEPVGGVTAAGSGNGGIVRSRFTGSAT